MGTWTTKIGAPLAVMAAAAAALPAHAEGRASKQETIGVTTGLAVGAAAGGPFGAIIGAAAGAWLGDRYHRKNVTNAALTQELAASHEDRKRLSAELGALNQSLARASVRGEQFDALVDGVHQLETSVGFRTGEAEVSPEVSLQITKLGMLLAGMPEVSVRIVGHADARGTEEYNRMLSERRAEGVAGLLAAAGLDPKRLQVEAQGETLASAVESDIDGLALDRKVTIRLESGAPQTEGRVAQKN